MHTSAMDDAISATTVFELVDEMLQPLTRVVPQGLSVVE
jgi:hypothetical protein